MKHLILTIYIYLDPPPLDKGKRTRIRKEVPVLLKVRRNIVEIGEPVSYYFLIIIQTYNYKNFLLTLINIYSQNLHYHHQSLI